MLTFIRVVELGKVKIIVQIKIFRSRLTRQPDGHCRMDGNAIQRSYCRRGVRTERSDKDGMCTHVVFQARLLDIHFLFQFCPASRLVCVLGPSYVAFSFPALSFAFSWQLHVF